MCDECYERIDIYGNKRRFKHIMGGRSSYHCLSEPAIQYSNGGWIWYKDNDLHREGGPAEYLNGEFKFYLENRRYNEKEYWERIKEYRNKKILDI